MDSLPAEPDPKFWIGILEKAYLSQLQSLWDERARFIQSESGLIVAEIISFEKTIEQTKSKSEANPAAFRTLLLRLKHWVDECSHKTTPFNPFSEQQRLLLDPPQNDRYRDFPEQTVITIAQRLPSAQNEAYFL